MLLDRLRTPNIVDEDLYVPSEDTDGSWAVWDTVEECEVVRFEGVDASRKAKGAAIDAIIECAGFYDGTRD